MGWHYAAALLGVNVTALLIYRLLGHFGPFHAAGLLSLLTIVGGLVPDVHRRPGRWRTSHACWMGGSYVGLLAAAVAEVATRGPGAPLREAAFTPSLFVGAVVLGATVPRALRPFGR